MKLKKFKLFHLHCSCETLLSNQVRRIWKWSKILRQINQEILKTSKNNCKFSKAFHLMCHYLARICWEHSIQVFLFAVFWFKWSVKKHCVTKVLLAIWETILLENNRNYNSYRFSYKFVFTLFLWFLTNRKQESGFHQVGGLVMRNIAVFCL